MNGNTNKTIWTVGHSTNTLEEFVQILKLASIEIVADVRSLPGSRKFPHFNKENLSASLKTNNMDYIHIKKLGERRKVNKNSTNDAWRHPAFRGFADYMETDSFQTGLEELISMAQFQRTAIMCAEALWWRCHRSMISDSLKLNSWKVLHLFPNHKIEEHSFTQPAQIINNKLNYSLKKLNLP